MNGRASIVHWTMSTAILCVVLVTAHAEPLPELYENHGITVVARKQAPRENLPLSKVLGSPFQSEKIYSVWLERLGEPATLRFVCFDEAGVQLQEGVIPAVPGKGNESVFVFRERGHVEEGTTNSEIILRISRGESDELLVESTLRYTVRSLLFFRSKGEDRAVYSFRRLGGTMSNTLRSPSTR